MSIAGDGYVFVPRCVSDSALRALRSEADHLFRLKKAQDALSEDEYFDKGCALDFFTNNELREDAEARVSEDAFMYQRNRARPPQSRPLPSCEQDSRSSISSSSTITNKCNRSTSNSSPPTTAGASAVETSTERNCHHSCDVEPPPIWDGFHVSLVREVVFQTLARLAWDALLQSSGKHATPRGALIAQVQPPTSAAGEEAMGTDSAAGSDRYAAGMCEARRLLLFNEQYVVKPPNSSIEFGWHTDEREQLAMCVFAPGVQPPVYVSVWLALDDCDAANGCLEVYPHSCDHGRREAPGEEDDHDVRCLPAKAGDAVVFLSNVWHRSGPNRTASPRRVFYAQYSMDVVRATPSDPRPLSLAVPCRPYR